MCRRMRRWRGRGPLFMFSLIRRESKTVPSHQRQVTSEAESRLVLDIVELDKLDLDIVKLDKLILDMADRELVGLRYFRLELSWSKALQSRNVIALCRRREI